MSMELPENPSLQSATVGTDYLLKINTGTVAAPVWTLIGGQRSSDLNGTADSIDTSHKTSGKWKSTKPGLLGWTIDLSGLMLLNDDGVAALKYAWRNRKQVNIALFYPDGKYESGWGSVTDFSLATPHDGAAEVSGTIEGDGELSDMTTPASGV